MVERTSNTVTIKVDPSSDLPGIFHRVQWPRGEQFSESDRGILDNLDPYEVVEFNVSTCFEDAAQVQQCGETLSGDGQANVGSESAFDNIL